MTPLLTKLRLSRFPWRSAFPPTIRRARQRRIVGMAEGPAQLVRAVASRGSVFSAFPASGGLPCRHADHGADKLAHGAVVEGRAVGDRRLDLGREVEVAAAVGIVRRDRRVIAGEGD